MKTTGKKISGRKVFTYVFLTIAALISLFPFYFMFVSATNTNAEILSAAPKLFFGSHLAENFANLNKKMDLVRILTNSTIMTVSYTALAIVLHSMAGYALAKFEFKGKGLLFGLIMITMMIPAQVMYVPLFTLMNNIGWANTYQAVVLPGLAGAFGIFLMRQNMLAFPTSLIEAARIDGCGEIGIFLKVVLPSQKPAVGALGIYMFMSMWNNLPCSPGYAGWCGVEKRLRCDHAGDRLRGSAYYDHLPGIPEAVRGRRHGRCGERVVYLIL